MASSPTSSSSSSAPCYYLVPNLDNDDCAETLHVWIQPTIIDDEDLMFGGKALSAWYEEERRRLSGSASDEEEYRGRQRFRSDHAAAVQVKAK